MKTEFTHVGWFGLCPTYFGTPVQRPLWEPDAICVMTRYACTTWFLTLNFIVADVLQACFPHLTDPIRVTGKLKTPMVVEDDNNAD